MVRSLLADLAVKKLSIIPCRSVLEASHWGCKHLTRKAFPVTGRRLSSEALVEHLVSLEDWPWPEWGKARKPLSKVQVARMLKPLGVSPGTIRLADGSTPKGCYKSAFARYLSSGDPPF